MGEHTRSFIIKYNMDPLGAGAGIIAAGAWIWNAGFNAGAERRGTYLTAILPVFESAHGTVGTRIKYTEEQARLTSTKTIFQ